MPIDDKTHGRKLFFIIGPLRTGSSLMARCIDDHPGAICLCESEINKALFEGYHLELHCRRMLYHGVKTEEAVQFLNRKKQDDVPSFVKWYQEVSRRLTDLYEKNGDPLIGDKSPDYFLSPTLVKHLSSCYPLIYTVRDPRAILHSINVQDDAPPIDKESRWGAFAQNFSTWKPYLDAPNVLVVRYEDLITRPGVVMRSVYSHVGLPFSSRFMESFKRPYPGRFLWTTAVDWETGTRKEFDPSRISHWRKRLSDEERNHVNSSAIVMEFMERFGYSRTEDETSSDEARCSDAAGLI